MSPSCGTNTSSSDSTVISLHRVSKSFPASRKGGGVKAALYSLLRRRPERIAARHVVLEDVSLDIGRGEVVGIFGPNGCGKTTLLALMAGVTRPCAGQIRVSGRVVPLLKLGAGFHPDLSGRDNVLLNGVLLGLRRREVAARFDEIVEFAGLEDYIDEPVYTYSSGMVARLGFSVAVNADPGIILLDETLAVGDVEFRRRCEERLRRLNADGVTLVIVSNLVDDILANCRRMIAVGRHRITHDGPPGDVLAALGLLPPAADSLP